MSYFSEYIYETDGNDGEETWSDVQIYLDPEDIEYSSAEAIVLLRSLLDAITKAQSLAQYVGKPITTNQDAPLPAPIDSEQGSAYAALLAFSAARGKGEHPATLIKTLANSLAHINNNEGAEPAPNHCTVKKLTVREAYEIMTAGIEMPDDWEMTYKCAENVVEDITKKSELDYRIFYRREDENDAVYGGHMYDDDEEADSLCITYTVPNDDQGVECPQCHQSVYADDADSVADYAMCQTCLAAWRTAENAAPESNQGFSDQPPFLPIPEYWAARGMEAPTVDFDPSNMANKWRDNLLADLAYDKAFREMNWE